MVTCADIGGLLADYLEGETDPRTTRVIDKHYRECEDCRNFMDSYRRTPHVLRSVGCEDLPEELRKRLEETLIETLRDEKDRT